jgi:hypothetical protein
MSHKIPFMASWLLQQERGAKADRHSCHFIAQVRTERVLLVFRGNTSRNWIHRGTLQSSLKDLEEYLKLYSPLPQENIIKKNIVSYSQSTADHSGGADYCIICLRAL